LYYIVFRDGGFRGLGKVTFESRSRLSLTAQIVKHSTPKP